MQSCIFVQLHEDSKDGQHQLITHTFMTSSCTILGLILCCKTLCFARLHSRLLHTSFNFEDSPAPLTLISSVKTPPYVTALNTRQNI